MVYIMYVYVIPVNVILCNKALVLILVFDRNPLGLKAMRYITRSTRSSSNEFIRNNTSGVMNSKQYIHTNLGYNHILARNIIVMAPIFMTRSRVHLNRSVNISFKTYLSIIMAFSQHIMNQGRIDC